MLRDNSELSMWPHGIFLIMYKPEKIVSCVFQTMLRNWIRIVIENVAMSWLSHFLRYLVQRRITSVSLFEKVILLKINKLNGIITRKQIIYAQ
jgi:hypothetical protein